MKLYYNPVSTYCHKVMIALNEKGIAFRPELVNLGSPDARAAYEHINPLGKVPFLKPSEDWQVPESTSIIEYIEDKFPGTPRLIPEGGGDAARQVRFMDRMSDLYYNDPLVELLFQQVGLRPANAEGAARARRYVALTYGHWNERLARHEWLCGERVTMADCAAIPAMLYAREVAPFDGYARVQDYWERACKLPSYTRVRTEAEAAWKALRERLAARRQG